MTVFKPTGFHSFWFEKVLSDYVFNSNSKIEVDLSNKFPHREKYKRMWNGKWANITSSIHYLTFEQTILPSRNEYIRCYTYYFLRNSQKFKAQDIVHDDFRYYYTMEAKYKDLESTFREDFNNIVKYGNRTNKTIKDILFVDKGFPEIYKMYYRGEITPFSIIIFEKLFGIFGKLNLNSISIIDENKLNNLRILFDKLHPFLYNKNIKWIDVYKMHIKSLK